MTAPLERRYRRLLAWFPAEHRQMYGEEMVGVLLASASDGQRKPRPAELADLIAGGLRTRFRWLLRGDRLDQDWRDGLAGYSVAAPILMLIFMSYQLYNAFRFRPIFLLRVDAYYRHLYDVGRTSVVLMEIATAAMVIALIAAPALIRRQYRPALTVAILTPTVLGAVATLYFDLATGPLDDRQVGFTVFFAIELIAVVVARDPGRGWRILGRKSLIFLGVVAVFAALETFAFQAVASTDFERSPVQIAIGIVAVALVLIFGSKAVKRMLALLAIPGYPILVSVMVYSVFYATRYGGPDYLQVLYLPTLVIALLVALAMWQASRQDGRPEPTSG